MKTMKKAIALGLAVSLAFLNVPVTVGPARADDSDIFGGNIQPNVLIALDTSGSMGDEISTWPFDPGTTYSGTYVASPSQGKVYKKTTSGYAVYKKDIASVSSQSARNALTANGFWSGKIGGTSYDLFTGNYLNWQADPRSDDKAKKIDIAKQVIDSLVNNTEGVRFGLMKFADNGTKGQGGGEIVAPIGSTKGDITAKLGGLSPQGWTPLGEIMRDAGKYYEGKGDYYGNAAISPIQYECQPNFIILISDGLENGTLQLQAEAAQRQAQDHHSGFSGKQNVIVHTVGFAIDPGEKDAANDVLQKGAKSGGGSFYYASNAAQLEAALQDAIRQIVAATFSFATPVVPTTSATGSDKAYLAAFQSNPSRPFWRGYLKAYKRGSDGTVKVDPITGVPLDSELVWEAGDKLSKKAASSRTIYTLIGGTRQDFAKSNSNITDSLLSLGASVYQFKDKDNTTLTREFSKPVAAGALAALDIKLVADVPGAVAPPGCGSDCYAYNPNGGDPTSIPPANLGYVGDLNSAVYGNGTKLTNLLAQGGSSITRDALIDFIRGVDSIDENGNSNVTEEREWKLGDIFHSSPVLVTPPIAPSSDSSYITFRDSNKTRTTILLTAANDGMLHAFRESDGEELWAFIPPDQLGRLNLVAKLSGPHPFFADSSPVVADVKIGGNWKTIAVFGERRGGRNYHALDITDTTNPQYLWSFTDSKMGETWSEAVIGKMKLNGAEKFVAIVGGGYDTDNNNATGMAVFAIDVANGAKLWEYYNNSSSDDRQYMNYSIPANATIADLDLDGYIDRFYIGDLGGQLWKFGPSDPALPADLATNWKGKRLFDAPPIAQSPPAGEFFPEQAIYGAPIPAFDDQKNLWIYFGTGDRNHPNNTTAPNRFYGIKDNTTMANGSVLTEANLVDVTSNNATATQGWYFMLGDTEKVLASADVFNKVVFFSTFIPTGTTTCTSGGGAAKLYAIQMVTGYAAMDFSTGVALATTDASKTRSKSIGAGIPSKPVIVLTESGATISTSVIAATTSQQLPSNPAPPPSAMRSVLYWRDMF